MAAFRSTSLNEVAVFDYRAHTKLCLRIRHFVFVRADAMLVREVEQRARPRWEGVRALLQSPPTFWPGLSPSLFSTGRRTQLGAPSSHYLSVTDASISYFNYTYVCLLLADILFLR